MYVHCPTMSSEFLYQTLESGDKSNLLIITILIYIHSDDECTFSHQLNLLTFAVADAKIIWKLPMAISKLATASLFYFRILYTKKIDFFIRLIPEKMNREKCSSFMFANSFLWMRWKNETNMMNVWNLGRDDKKKTKLSDVVIHSRLR